MGRIVCKEGKKAEKRKGEEGRGPWYSDLHYQDRYHGDLVVRR